MKTALIVLVASLLPMLGACGNSNNSGSASNLDLAGNWQMVLQLDPTSSTTGSGFLLQSGNALTGSVLLSGQAPCLGLGSAQGRVSASKVALSVTQVGQTVNLKGTAATNGSSMGGDYSILTNGCGSTTVGTWTADRVSPLKGTFQGTFISTRNSSLAYDVSITVAQAANNGASNASLSGTLASNQAPCVGGTAVAGVIGGTSVVLNFLAPDGAAIGQYRATAATDAKTLTGSYDFIAQNNGCSRDFGLAVMTLQQ